MFSKIAPDQWLSLSEASALLGVHASTLRRWADDGRVPCQRTPGGHRRFNRRSLLELLERPSSEPDYSAEGGPESSWRQAFEKAGLIDELRQLGQRLAGITMQFLLRGDNDERYLAEAQAAARSYAQHSISGRVSLSDAVRAYLYYRASYLEPASQARGGDPVAASRSLARYEYLMGQVLLALIDEYERNNAWQA